MGSEESKIDIGDFGRRPWRRWNNGLFCPLGRAELWKRDTEHPASICLVPIESFTGRAEAKEVILLIREGDEGMAFCMCSCDFLLYQAKEVELYFPKLFSTGEIASVRNTQCQHGTYAVIRGLRRRQWEEGATHMFWTEEESEKCYLWREGV